MDIKQQVLLKNLLLEDEIRGRDSTGVALLEDNKLFLLKKAIPASIFCMSTFDSLFKTERRYIAGIAHNRAASSGAVTDRNAHPFGLKVGNGWDCACHNGTFAYNIDRILQTERFDVDSETVLTKIARDSISKPLVTAMKDVLRKIEYEDAGNYAILYLSTEDKSILAVRDEERPLFFFDAAHLGYWFCSTEEIFKRAWKRLEPLIPDYSKTVLKFGIEPYVIYRLDSSGLKRVDRVLTKKEINEIKAAKREKELEQERELEQEKQFRFDWRDWRSTRWWERSYFPPPVKTVKEVSCDDYKPSPIKEISYDDYKAQNKDEKKEEDGSSSKGSRYFPNWNKR